MAGAASASPITVASYDMPNGNSGSYSYLDESYVGASPAVNSTTDGAALFGGKGDLTDGIIAANNWFVTEAPPGNGPYVGWAINPTITFHFAPGTTVDAVSFYLDDSNGNGSVMPPGSIVINGTNYVVPDPASGDPFVFTVNNLALTGDITTTLNRSGGWVFLSEVTFDNGLRATAVPEPLTLSIFGAGLAGMAALRRRRSSKAA
jgi:hypothetical protein